MHESELVGGVLSTADDPVQAGEVLVELLTSDWVDTERARAAGLEPVPVEALKRELPADRRFIELACASGVGWVLGRRSTATGDLWELVASPPPREGSLVSEPRRTTGETLIRLASTARERIRLVAPYVDEPGLGLLAEALVAATRRRVVVELFEPVAREPARAALKVMVVDGSARRRVRRLHRQRQYHHCRPDGSEP